ncbi:unnamed protein product [Paramecium primaurelia]|uniref:Uncharacterized protein n=1 Tax=Paramecium primaurelia TaxID=5886 RepID=A0A8S1QFU3_PARPR|nr:unnamed protein product [Paramecium primaurelia]
MSTRIISNIQYIQGDLIKFSVPCIIIIGCRNLLLQGWLYLDLLYHQLCFSLCSQLRKNLIGLNQGNIFAIYLKNILNNTILGVNQIFKKDLHNSCNDLF